MNELSKTIVCLQMRSGVEIWLEEEKYNGIKRALMSIEQSTFIEIDERVVNTADIVGIFTPADMDSFTKRKNGQWQCSAAGFWHDKGQKCDCMDAKQKTDYLQRAEQQYKEKGFKPLQY